MAEEDVAAWLKEQMKKDLSKHWAEEFNGPVLYGPGNFDVVQQENGYWHAVPKTEQEN